MDECGWEMAAASGRSGDGGEGGASVSTTLAVLFVMVVLAEVLLVSGACSTSCACSSSRPGVTLAAEPPAADKGEEICVGGDAIC